MKKYFIIIVLLSLFFSNENYRKENVLLIHVSLDTDSSELIKDKLGNLSISQVEKWIASATEEDVFNHMFYKKDY